MNDKVGKQLFFYNGKQILNLDEKLKQQIMAIANGMDNNENNIVLENTKNAGVGFCNKYFGWCSCCNGNDNAGLKASRDDGGYINVNHYQY